uniref:Uncharacterized protein LOC104233916 n=1 Tax=Nicotiana sylvestris TaxID=4096 RepID=A0A1U7X7M6_NICSY|nr:PREDICTED: uncharacterized protein LOC104233916 [Nicotiana sylvestris]
MTVLEYVVHFNDLARHAPTFVSTVRERVRRFIEGLTPNIRTSMAPELEMDISYQQVVSIARRVAGMLARDRDERKAKRSRESGHYSGVCAPATVRPCGSEEGVAGAGLGIKARGRRCDEGAAEAEPHMRKGSRRCGGERDPRLRRSGRFAAEAHPPMQTKARRCGLWSLMKTRRYEAPITKAGLQMWSWECRSGNHWAEKGIFEGLKFVSQKFSLELGGR